VLQLYYFVRLVRVLILESKGLASTLVVSDHRRMMFTILAMIDASAKIIGGPLMAALYSFGMDVGGKSAGLCLFSATASYCPRIFIMILNSSIGPVWCTIPAMLWY
jgi:hypothetical protein